MKPAAVIALLAGFLVPLPVSAQTPAGTVLEETVAPGRNYDQAQFKLWLPDGAAAVQAIALLVPGRNGDGRGQVDDPVWQAFAARSPGCSR